ncbi:MAG: ABC transporter ATP-binding protein [Patescibacteria group bacterium]
MKSLIECRDLAKSYRNGDLETPVLRGLTFTIADGECVAIMGPSGSGKSTLMNILGCLDTPTSGTYLLDGRDVSDLSDDDLAAIRNEKIGFVFQSYNLLSRTTVFRNVLLPLVYAHTSRAHRETAASKALRTAALPDTFWSYRPNQLSGGMMQRVAIARALVNNPSLLLADEPTGNLDSKTGESVLAALQALHRTAGHTIILITHELAVAEHTGRIITIRDGLITEDVTVSRPRIAKTA